MDVADGEDPPPTRLVVGIDGDTAVVIQSQIQPLKRLLGGKEADLYDGQVTLHIGSVRHCEDDLVAAKFRRRDLARGMDTSAQTADAGKGIRFPKGNVLADEHIDPAVSLQNHQGRVHRRVAAANHGDLILLVVADLGYFVVDLFRAELIENGQLPRVVQQSAGDDHFAANVAPAVCHEPLQGIILLYPLGVFDGDQFFVEAKLNECVFRLAKHPSGKLLPGNPVGKARNVDDLFIRVEELRLAARPVLGFDNQRRQASVGGREAGGESCGTRAHDYDVPVGET